MGTKKSVEIPFLQETPLEEIRGAKLSDNLTTFCHFLFNFKVLRKTAKVAYRDSAKAVIPSWVGIGLKPKHIDCVIKDIKTLYEHHQMICLSIFSPIAF